MSDMRRNEEDAFLVTLGYITLTMGGLLSYVFWGVDTLVTYLQVMLVLGIVGLGSLVVYVMALRWLESIR